MTTYNNLKKIIPPDQALANEALSRSLRQIKQVFDTTLPEFANAVTNLETTKDLNLINSLTQPIPSAITTFSANVLGTGTGANSLVTVNDVVGIAAGVNVNNQLPAVTTAVSTLGNIGALNGLTANAGSAGSASNGIYTQMNYCLSEAYGNNTTGITIPATSYWAGGSFATFDDAFSNGLIPAANTVITNIAVSYPEEASVSNEAYDVMANQLTINVTNCVNADIDIANLVANISNANLISNSISSSLSLASRLHDIGLDITEGGAAQFFEQIADMSTVTGQGVVASMREGRNIAVLNAIGINVDTQLVDVNTNTTVANNLGNAQYSVTEAIANIVI